MCNTKNKLMAPICMALSILAIVVTVHAHENQPHKNQEADKKSMPAAEDEVLKKINAEYISDVKPIFQKSCFDCHSSSTNYPWYAKLPGAKQLIEKDIRESKEHLDFSNDFPFGGHGEPSEDLVAIRKSIEEGSMPPFRYRILHPGSKLTEDEVKTVKAWIENSEAALGTQPEKKEHSGH